VEAVSSPALNIPGAFTIEAWVQSPPARGDYHVVLSKGRKNAGHFELYYQGGDGDLSFYAPDLSPPVAHAGVSVDDGAWHHVAVTFDGASMKFYKDGALTSVTSMTGSIVQDVEPLRLGRQTEPGEVMAFTGRIDEPAIYGRALSHAEVLALVERRADARCAVTPVPPPPPAPTPLPPAPRPGSPDLVAWWPGDGSTEEVVSALDGDSVGGATFGPGLVDQAFHFDGVAGHVEVADTATLSLPAGFSITGWVQSPPARDAFRVIVSKGQKDAGHYELFYRVATGELAFYSPDFSPDHAWSGVAIDDGEWHHFAATFDGSHLRFYVDGQPTSETVMAGANLADTEPLRIGQQTHTGQDMPFLGSIDELAIYRRALSAPEVAALNEAVRHPDVVPPVVTVPGDLVREATSAAGTNVTFTASATDDVDGVLPVACVPASGTTFSMGATTVACSATDAAGNTANVSFSVTVQDTTPPSLLLPPDITVEATSTGGAVVAFDVTAADAVDPAPAVACTPASGSLFPMGSTSVSCSAGDIAGNTTQAAFTVTVVNRPPAVSAGGPYGVAEGSTVTLTASASDPEGGAVSLAWDLDGDGVFETAGAAASFATAHDGPSSRTVRVRATDPNGSASVAEAVVSVLNVAPTVGAITAPIDPVLLGTGVAASVSFADAGMADTHTAVWEWGDGTTSAATITEGGGAGTAAGDHVYPATGVYTIQVTVADDDGGSASTTFQYVVVYDPSGGHVTGGGFIQSPPGAYPANPGLTGKATFGFVSKYLPGANVPTGNTQFHFQAAGFKFQSTSYEWLVVSGPRAQYKGEGTVNGAGSYGFLLTANDGQRPGGGGVDRLRLKVWSLGGGGVVYDNQMGQADDASAATALGGGSIVIHNGD
jgi:hypothetical protein